MRQNRGITLISLVMYIIIATIVLGTMAIVSSEFFSNMSIIKDNEKYAVEFNKFNMLFVRDVKNNKTAQVEDNKIIFEDGTIYLYDKNKKTIYRNEEKLANSVETATFLSDTYLVNNITKNTIKVNLNIGRSQQYQKEIEYVLKYW